MCAQDRRRFAQVIHMVVHSKAGNTFSCRAGRQRGQRAGALRDDRHPGRGFGLGLDDIAHDGGHRMLAAPGRTGGEYPQAPVCCHAHRDPPLARPRGRLSAPGSAAAGAGHPRLRDHDHEPEPEPEAPVPIDDRVQQLITGK